MICPTMARTRPIEDRSGASWQRRHVEPRKTKPMNLDRLSHEAFPTQMACDRAMSVKEGMVLATRSRRISSPGAKSPV